MRNEKDKRRKTIFSRFRIRIRCMIATLFPSYGADLLLNYRDQIVGASPRNGEDTILFACDDAYFHFAVNFLQSINKHEEHAVHVHLLSPSNKTIESMREYQRTLTNLKISFTWDFFEGISIKNRRQVYYTSARFILAPILLGSGSGRLLIVDVDTSMRSSPWPMLDNLPDDTSAAFVFRRNKDRAWQKILANAVMFKPDSHGKNLSDRYARALLINLAKHQIYHVDQLIAHYLIQLAPARQKERIKDMPSTVMSISFAEDAAMWTAKGGKKHSEMFKAIQNELVETERQPP